MASLPPRDWDDIATKQDIEVLRNEIRAELQQTRADLQHTISVNTRTVLLANVVVLATFVSTLL